MSEKIKLIIADDHKLFREGVISLLKDFDKTINVIGEADNGKNLLELFKLETPDVVLLDIDMPVMNGEEVFHIIAKNHKTVKIIFLSMHYNEELANHYLTLGAYAYLKKECSAETLTEAIHVVHKGEKYHESSLNSLGNNAISDGTNYLVGKRVLSDREIEVIKHICDGKSNKEIADTLFISLRTVDFHRGNIYAKTRASNSAALAVYALRHGIVSF